MAIKIKTRIALGGLFLFLLLAVVGAVSFYHFNKLITGSKDVLKANYETVEFANNMMTALHLWSTDSTKAQSLFAINLRKQEANITEYGESEMTATLRRNFNLFTQNSDSIPLLTEIRENISYLINVNLKAIARKSQSSQDAAEDAKVIITIIITICLLLGFTFIFNFPGWIAGPITQLTGALNAVSEKDYTRRIHLNRGDEFGKMADAFNVMAERLDEYEHSNLAKIMFEKQRAETVINSFKDASIGIDNKGILLFANAQALNLLNMKETDIVGRSQDEIKNENDLFRFLIENDNKTPFKVVLQDRENYFTKDSIEITGNGERLGKLIILENITPYKEMDVAKTNFIATISHELKTPLASSDFSLKLMEDERVGTLNEEQKQLVQSLKRDNQRLLRILSELLDLSQVEAGKMQLDLQPVSVNDIIIKAELSVSNAAKEKNITLKKDIAQKMPAIQADADKAVWIINNFLTNAIRYSPENSEITIKTKQANQQYLEIGVQDQGIGIDPSFQKKIFDRFFRVPGTRDKKGSGLGLAISKDFVEAMGGEIGVVSGLGNGSYFYCLFRISY